VFVVGFGEDEGEIGAIFRSDAHGSGRAGTFSVMIG